MSGDRGPFSCVSALTRLIVTTTKWLRTVTVAVRVSERVMNMRGNRMRLLGLVAALVAGLLVAPQSVQAGSVTGSPPMTGYQLRHWALGKHVGPNRYTYGGIKTITGFRLVATGLSHGRKTYTYRPLTKLTYSCGARCLMSPMSPDARQSVIDAAHQSLPATPRYMMGGEWYNPTSWDWGSIFGWVWDKVTACFGGALAGTVGTASGTLIVNLLARGGKVFVGPYGYAAIAVGGCFWSVVSS